MTKAVENVGEKLSSLIIKIDGDLVFGSEMSQDAINKIIAFVRKLERRKP